MTTPDAVAPRFLRFGSIGTRGKIAAGVFVVAFLCRLVPTLVGGGLAYYGRYDDGVYYAAADALTFGRIPYKQFILLHPPGIMLVLAPFALLGRITTDAVGLSVARLAFMGIGGLNAVLVCLLAYRWGKWQGILAGLMYAGWSGAVYSENATLLEPLGGTALLVALLLLLRRGNAPSLRAQYLAGAALGLACGLKIWYVVPWAVVVLYQLVARRYRSGLRMIVGGAIPLAVVLVPFFAMAPTRMYDLVVRDQVLRRVSTTSRTARLPIIFGMKNVVHHGPALYFATAVIVALTVIAALACIWERSARLIVAVLAGNLAVLYFSPSFFRHYSALAAAPIVLVLIIGVGIILERDEVRTLARPLATVALALLVVQAINNAVTKTGHHFPTARFKAAAPAGCISADDPTALINMNRLSSDLRDGCRVPVDVTGITYDTLRGELPNGALLSRGANLRWQQWLFDYDTSGSAFVNIRPAYDVIPPSYRLLYHQQPVLAHANGLRLRKGNGPS